MTLITVHWHWDIQNLCTFYNITLPFHHIISTSNKLTKLDPCPKIKKLILGGLLVQIFAYLNNRQWFHILCKSCNHSRSLKAFLNQFRRKWIWSKAGWALLWPSNPFSLAQALPMGHSKGVNSTLSIHMIHFPPFKL